MADSARLIAAGAGRLGLEPDAAALERLEKYVALTLKWAQVTNLTAATTPARFVREHLLDCLAIVRHLPPGPLIDVGSGAGLPGVVIAAVQAERPVWLIEPRARRARFLTQCTIELGLSSTRVAACRVEEFHPDAPAAVVVCRAFAPLPAVVTATAHLCAGTTRLAVMQAAPDPAQLAIAEQTAGASEILELKVGDLERRTLVVFQPRARARDGAGKE